MANNSIEVLMKCVNFAALKHRNQRRKDLAETPYINHPIGVANILTEEAGIDDVITIQAALLHDTVEDTDATEAELRTVFGDDVTDVVMEVTDDKNLSRAERKQKQVENAPRKSNRAKLVKLADKLYNLRDLDREVPKGWTDQQAQEYFVWSSQVVAGLRGTCRPLEDKLDALLVKHGVSIVNK